jgi:hypothetical protein
VIGEEMFKQALIRILDAVPANAKVFLLGANEKWFNPGNCVVYDYPHHRQLNRWMSDVVVDYPNVVILPMRRFIYCEAEVQTVNHFERMVYFRIYQEIARLASAPSKTVKSPAKMVSSVPLEMAV